MKTHGHSRGREGLPTSIFASWRSMKQRCLNPTHHQFHNYGGRGVQLCERWQSFENFLADMGERPEGTTLDRIDIDGNYEPANCRWADVETQRNNCRNSKIIEFAGKRLGVSQWARELGIRRETIWARIRAGCSVQETLSTTNRRRGGSVRRVA